MVHNFVIIDTPLPEFMSFINHAFLETYAVVEYCKKYDRKIICNGALMVCLNSLVLANHKQPFIANMLKLVDSTPH